MKKYSIYILVFLATMANMVFLASEINKNRQVEKPEFQFQIEELQKRLLELESGKDERIPALEEKISHANQNNEDQLKKLEDKINELQINTNSSDIKQLKAKINTIEKNIDNLNNFSNKNSTVDSYMFGKMIDNMGN